MRRQLRDQHNRIQEQHAQLAMAQQQSSDNIRGKKECELHVYDEMRPAMKNYEELESYAGGMMHEQEHKRHMSAVAEAQHQQEHMVRWGRITEETEAQTRQRQEELDQVGRNLERHAEELQT